jgi:hypothetical protein
MTAYEEFISNHGRPVKAKVWELQVDRNIDNLLDFLTKFLEQVGYHRTGYVKIDGIHHALFNDTYVWDGAIQDGNKIALRIVEM